MAAHGQCGFSVGSRWPLERDSLAASVYAYRRPGRIDDWAKQEGVLAAAVRASTIASTVACPIVVDNEVWGRISVGSTTTLPADTETRLTRFTELVAIAISNAGATRLVVSAAITETTLHAVIRDNGVGGAQPTKGSGLIGLADRVEAIGGTLTLESSLEQGTQIAIELPIPGTHR